MNDFFPSLNQYEYYLVPTLVLLLVVLHQRNKSEKVYYFGLRSTTLFCSNQCVTWQKASLPMLYEFRSVVRTIPLKLPGVLYK